MIIAPSLLLILGGIITVGLPKPVRPVLWLSLPLVALLLIWNYSPVEHSVQLAGFSLLPSTMHDYTLPFATIFAFALFAGALFGLKQARSTELGAAFVYGGAGIGITFAGDLMTLFIYWELLAIGSTVLIWNGYKRGKKRAGLRYALLHFFGGMVLLIGIAAHAAANNGDLSIASFLEAPRHSISWYCILIGVLLNAAAPPFSAWLPDAYPASSPFGAVFLSAFTTKVAVFVLLTLFAGESALSYIGLFMVFYGIIYALMEDELRRILSYSIVSQVGFMLCGIGIGSELALQGVAAHAFSHIVYKALLFMAAGSVIYMTGIHKVSRMGGLSHSMKFTALAALIGAASLSAFPLTSGFISKSLLTTAAADAQLLWLWVGLIIASAASVFYIGARLPWQVFFSRDSGLRPAEPPLNMRLAMLLMIAACLLPGLFPDLFYELFPGTITYENYTAAHVVTQLQLIAFSALAFFLFYPMKRKGPRITLDMDWFYRVLLGALLQRLERAGQHVHRFACRAGTATYIAVKHTVIMACGPQSLSARHVGLSATVLTITALLGLLLIVYYV